MLNKLLVSCVLALSIGVVGCGKTDKEKAEAVADRGNANIAKMNKLAVKLRTQGVGIQVSGLSEDQILAVSKVNVATKSAADKSTILGDLKKYLSLASETVRLGEEDNVTLKNAGFIKQNIRIARALISQLEAEGVKVEAAAPAAASIGDGAPAAPAAPAAPVDPKQIV